MFVVGDGAGSEQEKRGRVEAVGESRVGGSTATMNKLVLFFGKTVDDLDKGIIGNSACGACGWGVL